MSGSLNELDFADEGLDLWLLVSVEGCEDRNQRSITTALLLRTFFLKMT